MRKRSCGERQWVICTGQRALIGRPRLKACEKVDEVRIIVEQATHLCSLEHE